MFKILYNWSFIKLDLKRHWHIVIALKNGQASNALNLVNVVGNNLSPIESNSIEGIHVDRNENYEKNECISIQLNIQIISKVKKN